jgi:trans-2,3-dihydro-3-hydroxyanthranilate isomerase
MGEIMRKLRYQLVDVFTNRAFGGNPLAVFTNGRGLSSELMQAIAKELNLSEATFVLPAEEAGHDYRLRIFTPAVELPFAGHPTIGTAFVLALEQLVYLGDEENIVRLEEEVGTIPVTIRLKDETIDFIQMKQPLPTFGPRFENIETIAKMLSIEPKDIDSRYPIETVSCGVPFLYVPLKNLEAIRRVKLRHDLWEQALRALEAPNVMVFCQETETEEATVHSRVFAPAVGVTEDPATGSAAGPLGCYLVQNGLVKAEHQVKIINEQGFEMGRPSFLHIEIEQKDGHIHGVYVSGQCYFMGEGYLELSGDEA